MCTPVLFPDGPVPQHAPKSYVNKNTRNKLWQKRRRTQVFSRGGGGGGSGGDWVNGGRTLLNSRRTQATDPITAEQVTLNDWVSLVRAYGWYARAAPPPPRDGLIRRPDGEHECVRGCPMWTPPAAAGTPFVYFCLASGNLHLCLPHVCRKRVVHVESEVCELTGIRHPRAVCAVTTGTVSMEFEGEHVSGSEHESESEAEHGGEEEASCDEEDEEQHHEEDESLVPVPQPLRRCRSKEELVAAAFDALDRHESHGHAGVIEPSGYGSCSNVRLSQSENAVDTHLPRRPVKQRKRKRSATKTKRRVRAKAKTKRAPRLSRFSNLELDEVRRDRLDKYHEVIAAICKTSAALDDKSKELLVSVVETLWCLLASCKVYNFYSSKYRLQYHCLVVLYRARSGLSLGGHQVIPKVPWLQSLLKGRGRVRSFRTHWITTTERQLNLMLEACEPNALFECAKLQAKWVKDNRP